MKSICIHVNLPDQKRIKVDKGAFITSYTLKKRQKREGKKNKEEIVL